MGKKILGNTSNPTHYIKINFCGAWGYDVKVDELALNLSNDLGDIFMYEAIPDAGVTGRFEVYLFPNSKSAEGDGILLHSKKQTGQHVFEADYNAFVAKIEASIAWVRSFELEEGVNLQFWLVCRLKQEFITVMDELLVELSRLS